MEVEPKLLGIVLNEADKADTDSQVLEGVVGTLSEIGINVYDPIPRSGWLKRASALGQPLAQIRPSDEINNIFRTILADLISTNA